MSSAPRRLLAGVCTVVLLVLGVQLLGTVSADAHATGLSGSVDCRSDGTYTVTWTVANDYKSVETASVVDHAPAASTVAPSTVKLAAVGGAGSPSAPMVQSGIAGSAKSAYLKVKGVWGDGYSRTNDATISLPGTCLPGKQPTAPTSTNGGCADFTVVRPTLTIPSDTGVGYSVNGAPRASGTYSVDAGTYTILASSTTFALSKPTQWTLTVTEVQGDCLTAVTPVDPTVEQAVCTAGSHWPTTPSVTTVDTATVTYTVKPGGALAAGQQVEIDAVATAGHKFDTVPSGWTKVDSTHATLSLTLDAAPDCTEKTVPVNPTVTDSVCLAGSHTATLPTITLPADSAGITYVSSGPYTAGGSATVTATLRDGYKWGTLPGGWTVSATEPTVAEYAVTFAAAPDCREAVSPASPTVTQAVCPATGTTALAPTLTLPTDTAAITYTATPDSGWTAPGSATVTATARDGYKFAVDLPTGWSPVGDTEATFAVSFDAAATCVVPANPDVTQSACALTGTTPVPASVTPAGTTGIDYTVSAAPYDDTHPATVTATLRPGYQFDSGALPGWTFSADGSSATFVVTFAAAPNCAQTATPGFSNDECKSFVPTNATYTVPATTGVDYYVDSALTAPGTYAATDGSTITVVAQAQAGYTLVGTTSWTHVYTVTPTCTESRQAARASFAVQRCVNGTTLEPGTYTVPSSSGVAYLVNGVVVKAGSYSARPGTTVTVVAQAKPGYTLKGASRWTFVFGEAKPCSAVDSQSASRAPSPRAPSHSVAAETASNAASAPPAPLASTGVHSSSLLTVGAALLVLGVAVTLLAGVSRRRRTDGPRH